jgi:hypothetical protein
MYAHIVHVDFADVEAAVQDLDDIVPHLQMAPGFVAGYWIRLDDSHGTSVAVFDTEDQARATTPPVGSTMRGVTVTGVEVGEVLGHA